MKPLDATYFKRCRRRLDLGDLGRFPWRLAVEPKVSKNYGKDIVLHPPPLGGSQSVVDLLLLGRSRILRVRGAKVVRPEEGFKPRPSERRQTFDDRQTLAGLHDSILRGLYGRDRLPSTLDRKYGSRIDVRREDDEVISGVASRRNKKTVAPEPCSGAAD
jgi:hypothetical protein